MLQPREDLMPDLPREGAAYHQVLHRFWCLVTQQASGMVTQPKFFHRLANLDRCWTAESVGSWTYVIRRGTDIMDSHAQCDKAFQSKVQIRGYFLCGAAAG